MHKDQRGFAPLSLIVIAVVVLLIGAGGFYLSHNKKHNDQSQTSQSSSNSSVDSHESSQSSNDDSYKSLDAYIAKMSTADRINNINKSVKGLADCGDAPSQGASTTINGCFEDAFAQCKPVSATANSSSAGFVTRYVILGHDSKTGHCIGGYYYTQPDDPSYKGLGTFCALDTSTKPFLEAMSKVNSGSDREIETHCKQPANPRHI